MSNWDAEVCDSGFAVVGNGVAELRGAENSGDGRAVTVVELGIEEGITALAGKNWLAVGSGPLYRSGGFENSRSGGGGVWAMVGKEVRVTRTNRQTAGARDLSRCEVRGFTIAVSP